MENNIVEKQHYRRFKRIDADEILEDAVEVVDGVILDRDSDDDGEQELSFKEQVEESNRAERASMTLKERAFEKYPLLRKLNYTTKDHKRVASFLDSMLNVFFIACLVVSCFFVIYNLFSGSWQNVAASLASVVVFLFLNVYVNEDNRKK